MTDPITHANTLAEIDDLKARIATLERERDEWRRHLQECTVAAGVEHKESRHAADCAVLIGSCFSGFERRIAALEARNAALVEAVEGLVASANDMKRYGCMTQVAAWDRLDAALARAEAAAKGDGR